MSSRGGSDAPRVNLSSGALHTAGPHAKPLADRSLRLFSAENARFLFRRAGPGWRLSRPVPSRPVPSRARQAVVSGLRTLRGEQGAVSKGEGGTPSRTHALRLRAAVRELGHRRSVT